MMTDPVDLLGQRIGKPAELICSYQHHPPIVWRRDKDDPMKTVGTCFCGAWTWHPSVAPVRSEGDVAV